MKSKSFIILALICAALGSLTWILLQDKKTGSTTPPDTQLLADTDVNATASVMLNGANSALTLKKGEDVWTVVERYGYPADFGKIVDLIKKLKEMKSGRQFAVTDAIRDRLGLHDPEGDKGDPESKAVRVTLKDASDGTLADLLIGKGREADSGFGGHYLLPAGGENVHLVDKDFSVRDQNPEDWLDKELLDIASDSVQKVIARRADDSVVFTIERAEKGASPVLTPVPEGRKVNQGKLTGLMGALSSFQIEDVVDPALPEEETGLANAAALEFHQFDGTVTVVRTSTVKQGEDTAIYFRASVRFDAPENAAPATEESDAATDASGETPPTPIPSDEPGKDNSGENTDAAQTDDEAGNAEDAKEEAPDPAVLAAEAEKTNARISQWAFTIPQWKADRLKTEVEGYLEEIKEDTPADNAASAGGNQS